MFGRTSWLVASVASSVGLCQADQTTLAAVLPLGVFFCSVSMVLCRWTRVYDVVGVSEAPFYGSRHLQHKNVLITGANSGIGKETAIQLASMGATVYLLCRSTTRAQQAVDDILRQYSQTIQPEQLQVVEMDLGDLASIRRAVSNPLKGVEVHVLVNNAGLMMGTKTLSKDGMEMMMQANHLGHFLLTRLLLDRNNQMAKDARILNLTSSTYQLVETGFDFSDIMCDTRRKYTLFGQYAQTKLANILFSKELARRYPNHPVYAVHPGLVRTNVTSNMPWIRQTLNHMFAWFVASLQKIPSQGAYSNVLCAAGPLEQLPPSGSYIFNCQAQATTKAADSPQDAKRLWTVSDKLVGL
jgi:NAD(P)-dependent dehydrogenase (short-subunit alcohol dehydrogenase family)